MDNNTERRHGYDHLVSGIDWRDLGYRSLCALVAIGWFGFVAGMLALALERAP